MPGYPAIPNFPDDLTWDELHLWESLVFGCTHMDSLVALKLVIIKREKQ